MACRGLRSGVVVLFVFLFGGIFSSSFSNFAFGQASSKKTSSTSSSESPGATKGRDRSGGRSYLREDLHWNWNQRGRTVPGQSAAGLRYRAYQQKMAMRAARAASRTTAGLSSSTHPPKQSLGGAPASPSGSTAWTSIGPAPLASDATGNGGQDYNWISGRATSVLIDPADGSGNTVLLGGAYGGLWRSTNAGSQSPDPNPGPASVVWQPLIDDQPTLAVGAIALQPGNSDAMLVGTGETNGSSDSYYGLGILLSTNGGASWTQITGIGQAPNVDHSFVGIGFSKIAFSTAQPDVVVAAATGDNGLCLGEEAAAGGGGSPCLGPQEDGNSTVRGLYYSQNSGVTWSRAILTDGSVPASATAVIYNPLQGTNGTFYAFIRRHGLYSSTDGEHFAPVTTLPIAGLAPANCPTGSNATTCLIYRGEFAVVPGRNEMYVWVVDVQGDYLNGNPAAADEGIWQSTNGGASWTQIPDNGITSCGDDAFGPGSGCGVEQGWYNLALAAIPDGAGETDVYAGAVNLYKCSLQLGQQPPNTACTQGDWINLTHVYGCDPLAAPAHVHPDQHGIAFVVAGGGTTSPGYFAHDGGISRTLDGYSGLTTGSCSGTNQFDSLSQPASAGNTQTLGSMTEFVSVSVHPTSADILLGGAQNNGSPSTSTATSSSTFQNALGGDGGFTAINPTTPSQWFAENPYVTILACDSVTGTGSDCNDNTFVQVVGSNDLGGDQGAYFTPYILDPQNSGEMLVGTCRVWQITTSGTAPLQLSNDFETLGLGVCTGDEINLVNALAAGGPLVNGSSSVVYAVTNGFGPLSGSPGGEVWVTTSAGLTLMTNVTANATQNVNPNGYAISTVAMDSSDGTGSTAYVGIMGFSTAEFPTSHVWQTTNAGASWTDWTGTGSTELPDAPVNALLVDAQAGQVYAGTDVGVFVSATSAPNWTEVGPAPGVGVSGFLPNAPVTALQLFNSGGTKTLVASTYGRGIWNYSLAPDFAIAVTATPNSTAVNQNVTWNGTLTALNGFSGSVALTCTAGAPGTCAIAPATLTPTAGGAGFTVTLGSATDGTFYFAIQGTDGTLTHATPTETLTVGTPDFAIAVTATPNSTAVNQNVTWNGTLTALNGFSGTVALTCSDGAPGTCAITPATLTPTAGGTGFAVTLGSATVGTFNFAIQGADGALTQATPTETLTVNKATPTITWATPSPITYGTALSSTQLNATASVPGTFVYSPVSGTVLGAGLQTLSVTFTPTDTTDYNAATATMTLVVNKATPTITWATPSPITYGTALSSTQLNATASVPGTFAYSPVSGTVLGAGLQTLSVTFTPTDTTDYNTATATVTLVVTAASDFTWTDTGSTAVTVLAGQSASYTFVATPVGNGTFSSAVNLACANLPALTTGGPGASCGFSPGTIAAGAEATTVTVTITTIGPNLGAQSQSVPRGAVLRTAWTAGGGRPYASISSRNLSLFTLGWVLAMGIVGMRRKRLGKPCLCGGMAGVCLGLGLMALISCGGVAGSGSTTIPVTINPPTGVVLFADEPGNSWPPAVIQGSNQQQFTANQSVTWAVTGGNGNGTIGGTGLYMPPALVPDPATVTVTATPATGAVAGSAFLTVAAPTLVGVAQITVTATAVGGTAHSDVVTLTVQ
jgi:hypothetical protein